MWRRFNSFVYSLLASTYDPSHCEFERFWPIQSGADFHGWTRDEGHLYKLHANRKDICGSGKHTGLPIE